MTMGTRWTVSACCALMLALTACGGGESTAADTPRSTVRDSSGITIVDNDAPTEAHGLSWAIDADPTVSIGSLDGDPEYQLFRVLDALVLADGRIAVANRGSSEVRVYGADGEYLDTWGSEGEGPGEFTGLSSLARWPGDSLMAWDFSQRRATVFGVDGSVGRVFALTPSDEVTLPDFVAAFDDGTMLVRGSFIFSGRELSTGLERLPRAYGRTNDAGEVVVDYGEHIGDERYTLISPGAVSILVHPFARRTQATIWRGEPLISPSDDYAITTVREGGAPTRSIRRQHQPEAVTQAALDTYVASRLEEEDAEGRARITQLYEDMPLIETFPAFGDVLVDALDHLWVREYVPPPTETFLWTVFDPDGRVLGRIETPAGLEIMDIGADYVLGLALDDFEVEYVQLWGLDRG